MDAFTFVLKSLDDTTRLGTLLAGMMQNAPQVRALLLQGDLGSGKTTLTRSLVAALPGGDQAEISSPSFTICNNYPTCPPVLHCDLYRCPASLPDEVWDALDADAGICIVEWAQYIPEAALPKEFLDIRLESCEKGRFLTVMAHGQASQALAQAAVDTAKAEAQALAQELHTAWTTSGRHGSRTDLPLFS